MWIYLRITVNCLSCSSKFQKRNNEFICLDIKVNIHEISSTVLFSIYYRIFSNPILKYVQCFSDNK